MVGLLDLEYLDWEEQELVGDVGRVWEFELGDQCPFWFHWESNFERSLEIRCSNIEGHKGQCSYTHQGVIHHGLRSSYKSYKRKYLP